MTLMELLVALVIGSLVITLVVQGLGLGLNLLERVSRITSDLDVEFRENAWWTDSVGSLVACTDPAHCLQGNPSWFEGYTLAGIVHPSGERIAIRWELAETATDERRLQIIEGTQSGHADPLAMARSLPSGARFAYLHPNGRWLNRWNRNNDNRRLPEAIRIETDDGNVLAYATPTQRPVGKVDYREVLGL